VIFFFEEKRWILLFRAKKQKEKGIQHEGQHLHLNDRLEVRM
jgi:hypothetical protein